MKHITSARVFLKALTVFGLVAMATTATAQPERKPLMDKRGNLVLDGSANCVRTNWKDNNNIVDPCIQAEVSVTEVKLPFATEVTEEKFFLFNDLVRQSVYFDVNDTKLDADDYLRLNKLIKVIAKAENVKSVKVAGYADKSHNTKYNKKLSEQRVNSVLNELKSRSFIPDQVISVGYFGDEYPLTKCQNLKGQEFAKCSQLDRRVDIEIEVINKRPKMVKKIVYQFEDGQLISEEEYNNIVGGFKQIPSQKKRIAQQELQQEIENGNITAR